MGSSTVQRIARVLLALTPPLAVLAVQLALWPMISPYAWFMFVPALFATAWIGGPRVGIAASVVFTAAAWWFFVPPESSFGKEPRHLFPTLVFFGTGVLFSFFHERLRRATRATCEALAEVRTAKDEIDRLYRKARALDELKSQFVATVSHQLRTPLALVIGPIERLARHPDLDGETGRELEGAARSARVVLRHVNDLLDVAKLDAQRMQPERADVDLAGLVRIVAEPFEAVAHEGRVSLRLELPAALRAEVDPDQIRAVLTNLLSNALKFSPPEGHIRVSLRDDVVRGRAVLEVADSGAGVPLEERAAVFERFHQVEGTGRRHSGTGLGLAIARDFVSLHGGTIALLDAPEGGALLRVELPRRAPPGAVVRPPRPFGPADGEREREIAAAMRPRERPAGGVAPEGGTGPLVLVVEDNPDMNRFICESVPPDYRVASAFDGREGLDAALALSPDVMLVDVMMPEMSGEELVRVARGTPSLARVPILVLTAKADEELRIRMLREGAQDYLVKPFAVEELRARIENLTAAKRALEADARLAALVEHAPDGIFVADLEGRYTEVNLAGCRLLGLTREEILGKTIADIVPPEDIPRLRREREKLLGGGERVSEWRLRRSDGTYVPVEVNAQILADGRWQGFVRDISERRSLERELRQREGDLNRAQAVAHVGSWRLDVHHNELVWSDESYRIFGIPLGTPMTYEAFLAVVHPDDREYVDRMWRAALEGAPYDIEHRLLIEGEIKWVRERAELMFDEAGAMRGGIGTTQDISDRKRIELALRAAEQRAIERAQRTRALSDASKEISDAVAALPEASIETLMSVVAVQAQILAGAEYAAIGVGTDPEVPFRPWIQVGMAPELAARLGRPPRPVGTLGVVARQDRELRDRDVRRVPEFRGVPAGHPTIVSFLGVPIRFAGRNVGNLYLANKRGGEQFSDEDQRVVELLAARVGAALETARLYASEALGRAWMTTVVDQMPEGVLLLDKHGRITAENRSLRAMAPGGSDARDPFGNPIPIELHLPGGESVAPRELPYVGAMQRGESFAGREYRVRRRDGAELPVLVGVAPVIDTGGGCTGAVMIVQDVSALKELERLREEWTSIVAHDLRQPVNVIALSAGLLDESASAERRARAIASIRRAATQLDRMIGDLLDASRIEARRMSVQPRAISLVTVVREVLDQLSDLAPRCDLVLSAGADRPVLADAGRIAQVLTNLVTNAAKYGDPATRIGIGLHPRDAELEVVVTNRGPGISEHEMSRLFQRFERTGAARAGRVAGIGLGLYVCKGLIEAHEGRIWAESTPRETTSFHFTLPYAPQREASAGSPRALSESRHG